MPKNIKQTRKIQAHIISDADMKDTSHTLPTAMTVQSLAQYVSASEENARAVLELLKLAKSSLKCCIEDDVMTFASEQEASLVVARMEMIGL